MKKPKEIFEVRIRSGWNDNVDIVLTGKKPLTEFGNPENVLGTTLEVGVAADRNTYSDPDISNVMEKFMVRDEGTMPEEYAHLAPNTPVILSEIKKVDLTCGAFTKDGKARGYINGFVVYGKVVKKSPDQIKKEAK